MAKYTPRQLTTLRAAISHYEAQQRGEEPGVGADDCPLCQKYHQDFSEYDCDPCPIAKETGEKFCCDTPWGDWNDHYSDCEVCYEQKLPACPEGRKLHQTELDFLRSLLPRNRVVQR